MTTQTSSTVWPLILVSLLVGLIAALGLAVYLIGGEGMYRLLQTLLIGIVAVVALAAVSLPIRAWRKKDGVPIQEHHYHDGTRTIERTHTIDGRAPAPAPEAPVAAWSYPEMLRAAYTAGRLGSQSTMPLNSGRSPTQPDTWDGEIQEVRP